MEKKCCICGKIIDEWGNDPWGAVDENNQYIQWPDKDECCDECNNKYVLSGRLSKMFGRELDSKYQVTKELLKNRK